MDYSIIDFYKDSGVIVVMFDVGVFNFELPIIEGRYPIGAELDTFIQSMYPAYVAQRKQELSTISNVEDIMNLVTPLKLPNIENTATPEVVDNDLESLSEQEELFKQGVKDVVIEMLQTYKLI